MEGRGNSTQNPRMLRLIALLQYSTEVELPYIATFDSSPHQEIIFSNCIIQPHSLRYENAFLLHFFQVYLKIAFFKKKV
jgi:hypothetical protein